jgi:hypothetical protein
MILQNIPKSHERIFKDLKRSYIAIRKSIINFAREVSKLTTFYSLLGDWVLTNGIKINGHVIKIDDVRRQKKYEELSFHLYSLVLHLTDVEPYTPLEEMGIETIPPKRNEEYLKRMEEELSKLKTRPKIVVDGKEEEDVKRELEEYLKTLPFDSREKFLDSLRKIGLILFGPIFLGIDRKKNILEDLRKSFSAKDVVYFSELSGEQKYRDYLSHHIVLVDPLFDVHQLDIMIGAYKLRVLNKMLTPSLSKLEEPLDLIIPLDRLYEPFELSEKNFRECIEEFHFRVKRCISLVRKKLIQVLTTAQDIRPLNYDKLVETLNSLDSFLERMKYEMNENKKRELILSQLYLNLLK